MKKDVKGFTLLEMLVVVLIIGILAAIALPQYNFAVAKSKFATLKDNLRTLYEAEQRYYLVHDNWAFSKNDLDLDIDISNCSVTPCCEGTNKNPYVGCSTRINGTYMAYIIWLRKGKKSCLTNAVDNENDITHRLCQAESSKKQPRCDLTNCQYLWY